MAIQKATEDYLSKDEIKLCDELGIKFSEEIKHKIFEKMSKNIKNNIDSINKRISEDNKEHKDLMEELTDLQRKFI